ncbi:hypothetical protein [Rathayibacter sp. SD072]|uniref:hypothetical protein n=1 Tax=Rathayibacter sp. SD072 TaxID=2781731 RepID=UPI001A97AF27|nr:hypothetical protein [Rathayibacter sp. SD072]MBO0982694.1 hypothetical protein [Rathayibacter sp. SD072]
MTADNRRARATLAGSILLLALTGCASGTSAGAGAGVGAESTPVQAEPAAGPPVSTADASDLQKSYLEDGSVSEDEYTKSFQIYSDCMAEEGFPPTLDKPSDSKIIKYSVDAKAVDSGVEGDCYAEHFKDVDVVWQVSQGDK